MASGHNECSLRVWSHDYIVYIIAIYYRKEANTTKSDYQIGDKVMRKKPLNLPEYSERNVVHTISRIEESKSGYKGSNALYFRAPYLKSGEDMIFECGVMPAPR